MTLNDKVTIEPDENIQKFRFFFTMAIGLGFATTQLTWTFYNSNMIGFLQTYFQSRYPWLTDTMIGFVMTWDNIIAIFVQPYIGAKSDNTKTRFGKRTPYILVGLPIAAAFFAIIPLMRNQSILFLILTILAFNLSMAIYRSPVVALMPDLTTPKHRTNANGVINMMGGIFAGIALFLGGSLVESHHVEIAFSSMSVIMIISLIAFLLLVREPKELAKIETAGGFYKEKVSDKKKVSIREEFFKLFSDEDKSKLYILLAIASWFVAWNALEVWVAPYISVKILGNTTGTKAFEAGVGTAQKAIFLVPIVFVIMTLPGGYLGYKFGRRPVIRIGLLIFIIAMAFAIFQTSIGMVALAFIIAAAAWGLINVNSIVIVWELSKDNIGAGTGLYYLASSLAAILGPITFGTVLQYTSNYGYLWYYSIFFLALALLFMFKVVSGEAPKKKLSATEAIS